MGSFAGNDGLDVLEAKRVTDVVGLASNPPLERPAGAGPNKLLAVLYQSGPGVADGRGVYTTAGVATTAQDI